MKTKKNSTARSGTFAASGRAQEQKKPRVVTTKTVTTMKHAGEKIVMLTAYDYLVAKYLDQVGVDIILVGDSLGNVVHGYETTLPVTVDDMIYHAKAVKRAVKNALIVVDMPFMSFQASIDEAIRNAGRIMKEVGVGAVKLEGGEYIADIVHHLVKIGIPVMGHLGLTPQAINKFGTYEVRATDKKEADELLHDAKVLADAGVFSIVLEKIPTKLAKRVTESVPVPTIGIGAGPFCDGQVLVVYDMLGLTEEFKPRFVRRYTELAKIMRTAFEAFIHDVKEQKFPTEKESY
ncbi:MAG: 3-methyl-2-oxobutanoate hydroxymethyltransferase [Ignavibacteriae bacterium]|nr:3-methyl-2-oxobutanoate hydroxymethyltransferase [Ignavibacteria bacterium]MBI3365413.1 3-methyl-2-oxobutanoate hydroxymethyltransferase [Ignavibacteriota bacterium]